VVHGPLVWVNVIPLQYVSGEEAVQIGWPNTNNVVSWKEARVALRILWEMVFFGEEDPLSLDLAHYPLPRLSRLFDLSVEQDFLRFMRCHAVKQ
jgi:hypothetical protein